VWLQMSQGYLGTFLLVDAFSFESKKTNRLISRYVLLF
jgi:hypothetical protein